MALDNVIQSLRAKEFDNTLDEEGARSEEIKRLQGFFRAYRGHLTRNYNKRKFLCSNSGSLREIMLRKSTLDDLFARYTAAFRSSLKSLVKLEEQWKVNDKAFFNEKSTRWINLEKRGAFPF